jgi:NIPSNAP
MMSEGPVLDLRTYRLVPDGREIFDRILRNEALPMLESRGIDVVAYGPSLVDENHYYLARAFPSEPERKRELAAFYGSEQWRREYAETVTTIVETFHHLVIPLTPLVGSDRAAPYRRTA